jgi:hypothetical protein
MSPFVPRMKKLLPSSHPLISLRRRPGSGDPVSAAGVAVGVDARGRDGDAHLVIGGTGGTVDGAPAVVAVNVRQTIQDDRSLTHDVSPFLALRPIKDSAINLAHPKYLSIV